MTLVFMCAFCGGDADEDRRQLVLVSGKDGSEQSWWCHFQCFYDAICEDARYFPGDAA